MVRILALAALLGVWPGGVLAQTSTLHIKVMLADADGKPLPVVRHALLISDDPPTAAPHRVLTSSTGAAEVTLRPGSYVVESERPVASLGKGYEWMRTVKVPAGQDVTLELNAANAEIGPAPAPVPPVSGADASALEPDAAALLTPWRGAVVTVWTPTTRASGFVVDRDGLIATSQRVVGAATSVEIQFTAAIKVGGRVVIADTVHDVAFIRIDPHSVADAPPPLPCGPAAPAVTSGQPVFAIAPVAPGDLDVRSGVADQIAPDTIVADLRVPPSANGGPVVDAGGHVLGITSALDDSEGGRAGRTRIVRVSDVCTTLTSAESAIAAETLPGASLLPVEPSRTFADARLADAVQHRAGSLSPYELATSDFDVRFITPVMVYAAAHAPDQSVVRPEMDFGAWSEYVAPVRAVVYVRVTPKLAESLWTTVARGAAMTQGVSLPAFKRYKSGFLRMRLVCGGTDVTPIHPFVIEQRVSETQVVDEGFYVFDPSAFTPSCGEMQVVVSSQKDPDKEDERAVPAGVIRQIAAEFTP